MKLYAKYEKEVETKYFFIIDEINRADLSKVFDIVLNARIEDLRGLGIDIDELNNKIQTAMNFIQPTEVSDEDAYLNTHPVDTSSDKNKKQDDDDYLW